MSRKTRSSTTSSSPSSVRRDTSRIANSKTYFRTQPELPFTNLNELEDRRTFHPHGQTRSARSFRQRVSNIVATSTSPSMLAQSPTLVSHGLSFQAPPEVLVCVRRQRRREVLHAYRKTGRVGQKSPRRSYHSDIKCK